MGKRQLGQLQPFEFVITLIIADLATLPMSDRNIPLINGIVPLITLLIIQFTFSVICRKSNFIRRVLNGKPIVIISPNGIDYNMLKELNMNMNDLQEAIRCAGTFKFEDIAYAIVETNGTITVLPKSQQESPSREDMCINAEPNGLPRIIICDGKLVSENLVTLEISDKDIDNVLSQCNIKSITDIVICTADDNKNIFVQNKDSETFEITLGGENEN
ncbi:MAG: DUF421 domain-containing protein [Clostridia bacterium]|nr:DUF421 domain-containing protein [Clostridia bacterium]